MKRYRQIGAKGRYTDNRIKHRTQHSEWRHRLLAGVRVFLLVILQVSLLPRIGFLRASPDILLPFIVVLAVTGQRSDRARVVSVTGILTGFLADTLGSTGIGVLCLFYFLVGAVLSAMMRSGMHSVGEDLLRFYAVLVPVTVLRAGVTLVGILLKGNGFDVSVCLFEILIPACIGTLLFALPIFFLFRGRD